MRNHSSIFVAAICLLAAAAAFSGDNYQPLNVKTGLWQVTEKTAAKNLPPQLAAMANRSISYKTCVTAAKLKENPFTEHKCHWTMIKSNSSDMEAKGTGCDAGKNGDMSTDVHYKLHAVDSEHVDGSGDWTSTEQGQTITGTITGSGHWIGVSCGDVQ